MLTRGELHPGSRLPVEKDLAAQLGVSRGSLREGVRALATLGVLETRQGDGTYVTALDPRTLLSPLGFLADLQQPAHAADLLAVRRVLETESVVAGGHAPHRRRARWSSIGCWASSTASSRANPTWISRRSSTPTPSSIA